MNTARENDRGAALVTVLTMMAVMSTLAVIVVDAANMSLRRTANLVRMEQTRWYLAGAESFAAVRLSEWRSRADLARVDQAEWQHRPFVFPLDDGSMEVSLRDGGNCFNLNSLVIHDDSGRWTVSALGMVQFSRLLDAVGVHAGQTGLAASLADWIDSDTQVTAGGAEDEAYGGETSAYRTANTLMADVSELRRVRGFSDAIVGRLAPFICVRPTAAPNQLNPNTLTPDQAPLLVMALGGDVMPQTAAQIIRDRPAGGWENVDAFLLHPRIASVELNESGREQFTTRTRYYVLHARVEREDGRESSASLLEMDASGRVVVLRRLFGAGVAEHLL